MDIRKRIFSRHMSIGADIDHPIVHVGSIALQLLLFEKLIFESACLVEFPTLVRVFGMDGVKRLLASGAVDIQCEAVVIGQIGQSSLQKPNTLPPLSYGFTLLREIERKQYIHLCMDRLQWGSDLRPRDVIKMKGVIADRLIDPPPDFGRASFNQSKREFVTNAPIVKKAVAMSLGKKLKGDIPGSSFDFTLHQIGEDAFRAETDIGAKFNLQDSDVHKLVETGLLGVPSFNKKIEQMKRHNAIAIFNDDDIPLLDDKLDFLMREINPETQRERPRRILTITGMPDIERAAEDGRLIVPRLLKIRESRECREFREWLASVDSASDRDIQDQFSSLRARLSVLSQGTLGKTVRWLASTALGCVPPIGPALGAAAGLLDTFLVEKILPHNGPVTFLRKDYPSVFEKDN